MAAQGSTKAQDAVIATNPQSKPLWTNPILCTLQKVIPNIKEVIPAAAPLY